MITDKEIIEFYAEFNKIDFDEAERKIERFINALSKSLELEDEIEFENFGTFKVEERKRKNTVNLKTNKKIIHRKSRKCVKFKMGKDLKNKLDEE